MVLFGRATLRHATNTVVENVLFRRATFRRATNMEVENGSIQMRHFSSHHKHGTAKGP